MDYKNPRTETGGGVANQRMTNKICEEEVREALGGTECGKATGTDGIPMKEWECMSKCWVQLL